MNLQWSIVLLAIALNSAFCFAMYWVQQRDYCLGLIPARGSIIPGTSQKFLYWQDFYCQRWGNTLCIPLIFMGFFQIALFGPMPLSGWIVAAIFGIVDGAGFTWLCLQEKHKPDWGFPEVGAISTGGKIHGAYHFLAVGAAAAIIWLTFTRGSHFFWPLLVGWIGMGVYSAFFIWDLVAGHFDPLQTKYAKRTQG